MQDELARRIEAMERRIEELERRLRELALGNAANANAARASQ